MRKFWWALVGALTVMGTGMSGSLATIPTAGPSGHPDPAVGIRLVSYDTVRDSVGVDPTPSRTPPQRVVPGMLLVQKHHERDKRRTARVDKRFFEISATGSNDIPVAALNAYHHAATVLAQTDPSCHISWTFLAGIGRVESDHGRYGGSVLSADGVSRPEILGPVLDGAGPFAAISDTDNGRLDHNTTWDRAVGQMQFLPSTWAMYGRDGDGDGVANPDDINDSALAAGTYLCAGGMDLSSMAGMAQGAYRYNQSDYYVSLVLAFTRGYRTGVFVMPSPPAPDRPAQPRHHQHHARTTKDSTPRHRTRHHDTRTTTPTPKPSPKPAPKPSPKPSPSPSPKPSPSPSPSPTPTTKSITGTWAGCGTGWCVDGVTLDLGTATQQGQTDSGNVDNDPATLTWADEFPNLAGKQVTVVIPYSGTATVKSINGISYP